MMFVLLKFPVIVKVHIHFGLCFGMSLSGFNNFPYLCCCMFHVLYFLLHLSGIKETKAY